MKHLAIELVHTLTNIMIPALYTLLSKLHLYYVYKDY